MTARPESGSPQDGARIESAGGCLLLVFSQFGGALAVAVLALLIAMREPWHFSLLDVAYFVVLALWILAQRAQHARESAPSAGGDPAAPWTRVAALSAFGALAVWVVAHLVQLG